MMARLIINRVTDRGVCVSVIDSQGQSFWLPRMYKGITWSMPRDELKADKVVTANIPFWLAARHQQLSEVMLRPREKPKPKPVAREATFFPDEMLCDRKPSRKRKRKGRSRVNATASR